MATRESMIVEKNTRPCASKKAPFVALLPVNTPGRSYAGRCRQAARDAAVAQLFTVGAPRSLSTWSISP